MNASGPDAGKPFSRNGKWPWYRPMVRNWRRYYLRQFPRKKKLHGTFLHRMLGNRLFDPGLWVPTRDSVAKGVAIGVFIGFMPFFGLQIAFSLLLCFIFRVNVTAAVVATFISNPLTGGGIIYLQLLVGKWLSTPVDAAEMDKYAGAFKLVVLNAKPLMIGATVTGLAGALLSYPITLLLWNGVTTVGGKALARRHAHHPHDSHHPDSHHPQHGARTLAKSEGNPETKPGPVPPPEV